MARRVDWSEILGDSPIDWLLERSNPSVRYFTLVDVLGKPQDDLEVRYTKKAISESATVQMILRKQNPLGYWENPNRPYVPKYKSSYWTVMVLGNLGIDKTCDEVAKACEFIFQFQLEDGGFPCENIGTGRESQLSCLTGNMVAALVRLGYENDSRVKRAVNWLVRIQNRDGGWLCPYWKAHAKDRHGCFMGTICPLEAFSEIRSTDLKKELTASISNGAEFLLMHRLFKADHHNYRIINQAWLELGFPWFFSYNILRGLDVLTKLGYVNDPRLEDGVDMLLQKRQKNGSWVLENSPVGRMQVDIETKGQPSKWITLIALRMLKRLRI